MKLLQKKYIYSINSLHFEYHQEGSPFHCVFNGNRVYSNRNNKLKRTGSELSSMNGIKKNFTQNLFTTFHLIGLLGLKLSTFSTPRITCIELWKEKTNIFAIIYVHTSPAESKSFLPIHVIILCTL